MDEPISGISEDKRPRDDTLSVVERRQLKKIKKKREKERKRGITNLNKSPQHEIHKTIELCWIDLQQFNFMNRYNLPHAVGWSICTLLPSQSFQRFIQQKFSLPTDFFVWKTHPTEKQISTKTESEIEDIELEFSSTQKI